MKKQRGYTLFELLFCIAFAAIFISGVVVLGYLGWWSWELLNIMRTK